MKILLIYPESPSTFYSFRNALKFISKKSAEPPLGLITVAAMLPEKWEKKLIDMNVSKLKDKYLDWADYVFISGMNIHKSSFKTIVKRCNQFGVKVVAGGPMVTADYNEFQGVDHFVLNEAEVTLPRFLKDLENDCPKHIYASTDFPDIITTPVPLWNLLDIKKYATIGIQYSRGCPYNCEFCSITMLNGRRPRTKSKEQFIRELDSLYQIGWRGDVFVVDDNFIGNRRKLKSDLLPALIEYSKKRKYPFSYTAEVSINLADDDELANLMIKAGFNSIFVGIESPNDDSLAECGKSQNRKRDLIDSVKKLQRFGFMVGAGFIVGFDNDPPNIFKRQINFIQKSGIATAMVGILNAPEGTRLFHRLKSENRLLNTATGDNMDGTINFIPKMNYHKLMNGYKEVLNTIYAPKAYYERVRMFLKEFHPSDKYLKKISIKDIKALVKSFWLLGILEKGRVYFWRLFFLGLFKHPQKFSVVITLAIYGFHFRQIIKTV
ncbi:MAG: B12-binding domain-containing radical SAM protein [Candidatus Zixiibacteriota bacterium]|nr:MAG: B12-binding domain-containing radical SAM protein [candidate division Zixibacteria bacterium]